MTLEPVRNWRIHLGAHKTATTHLQDTLASRRDALLREGVDYLPLDLVRPLRLPPAEGRFRWRTRMGWPMRREFQAAIDPLRRGPSRVAFSEENLVGWVRDLLSWPFYPELEGNLRPFSALCHTAEVTLFLSIRSFDKVLPSAYAQQLRFRPVEGGFASIAKAAVLKPPSWLDVIQRIRCTLPKADLRVWLYEDYRKHDWEILSEFCGVPVPRGEKLPPSARTRSPSAQAIAALENISAPNNSSYRQIAADIINHDRGDEPFDPFSREEKELLREAYRLDIAEARRLVPEAQLLCFHD